MEELVALCERRLPSISLSRNWEHFTQAKQLLADYGYVEVEAQADEDDGDISFTLGGLFYEALPLPRFVSTCTVESGAEWYVEEREAQAQALDDGESPSSIGDMFFTLCGLFQSQTCDREVKEQEMALSAVNFRKARRGSAWKACPSLQIDTSRQATEERLLIGYAQSPSVPRKVGMQLVVQPFVKLDEAQLYVRLRIDKFLVGVLPSAELCEKQSLGFYPSFVKLSIEPEIKPEVESEEPIKLVYVQRGSEDEDALGSTSSVRESSTTIGGEMLHDGIAASFEWSILRWKHGAKYKSDSPQAGLRRFESPLLSLDRGVAKVEGFPDVLWRFPLELKDAKLQLKIQIQVHMHALGNDAMLLQFENVWLMEHRFY